MNANSRKISFIDLFNKYNISIPTIQRDYVQGREDNRVVQVREGLLKSLADALINKKTCHLNFTIGVKDYNNKVFLLDGQQRITTLFLLHYYVSLKKNKSTYFFADKIGYVDGKEKLFTYHTRYTTQRFLDSLMTTEDLNNFEENIEKTIKETSWYSNDYDDDVSIKSMICVLQKIEDSLKDADINQIFDNLFNNNLITFFFMMDEKIKEPHEHYIKINSRGKSLNDFELFKSDFFKLLSEKKDAGIIDIGSKDYKQKLDSDWYEYCWNCISEENQKELTDLLLRDLIKSIFVSSKLALISTKEDFENEYKENNERVNEENIDYKFGYSKDDNYLAISLNYFEKLLKFLIFVNKEYKDFSDYYIKPFLISESIKQRKNSSLIETQIISSNYSSRIFLFCLSHYLFELEKNLVVDDENKSIVFKQILKMVVFLRNIISNDDKINLLEDVYTRCNCFFNIKWENLATINLDLVEKMSKFDKKLMIDELTKQELINKNADLLDVFYQAEKSLPFFNGRITYAIRLSSNQTQFDINLFNKIIANSSIFNKDNYHTFISYFLSKSSLSALQNCVGNTNNNIHTIANNDTAHYAYHWRALFNDKYSEYENGLRELLDKNNEKEISKVMLDSKNSYLKSNNGYSFEKLLVEYEDVLEESMSVCHNSYGKYWQPESENFYLMINSYKQNLTHYKLIYLNKKFPNSELVRNSLAVYKEENVMRDNSYLKIGHSKIFYNYKIGKFCKDSAMNEPYLNDNNQEIGSVEEMINFVSHHLI